MRHHDRPVRVRLGICLIIFISGFAALMVRAWQLQLIADRRIARLHEQQLDRQIKLTPQRGVIYDAKGIQLAVGLRIPSIFADPSKTKLSNSEVRRLASILQLSLRQLQEKLKNHEKRFVWLKRHVDPVSKEKVEALKIHGIYATYEWSRFYPQRELAAQVIGFIGTDGVGLEGIERFYDRFLQSESLVMHTLQDAKGRPIYSGNPPVLEPEQGASLYLTLDSTIQHFVEKELREAAENSGSKAAMGVVMDPTDGRILAMASYPFVNPNRLDQSTSSVWRNRPVEEIFEPGSTFKVFTLAAALEAQVLSPTQNFLCRKGSLTLNGKTISNVVEKTWLTADGILKFSNNVCAARIGLALGRERIADAIFKFGFLERTGIDFPSEAKGLLTKSETWRPIELANISFGQGIGVTAIQMVSALSAIANGGHAVTPYLVERGVFPIGKEIPFQRGFQKIRIFTPRTAKLLGKWMEGVTGPDGSGFAGAIPGYRVAGKTGTAQIVEPTSGKYSNHRVMSSFMGFAPASDPRLAAIFVFREPQHADYGGVLAAPVFSRVISESLTYLGVPPDQKMDVLVAHKGQHFSNKKLKENTEIEKLRQDIDLSQYDGAPDFRGMTIREVLSHAQKLSLNVRIVGSGVAIRQEPAPGKLLSKNQPFKVYFTQDHIGERT